MRHALPGVGCREDGIDALVALLPFPFPGVDTHNVESASVDELLLFFRCHEWYILLHVEHVGQRRCARWHMWRAFVRLKHCAFACEQPARVYFGELADDGDDGEEAKALPSDCLEGVRR